jgi:hypothetical protein
MIAYLQRLTRKEEQMYNIPELLESRRKILAGEEETIDELRIRLDSGGQRTEVGSTGRVYKEAQPTPWP